MGDIKALAEQVSAAEDLAGVGGKSGLEARRQRADRVALDRQRERLDVALLARRRLGGELARPRRVLSRRRHPGCEEQGTRQRDLPHRRSGLAVLELERTLRQLQHIAAERPAARCRRC